jgi:hypothetical protein
MPAWCAHRRAGGHVHDGHHPAAAAATSTHGCRYSRRHRQDRGGGRNWQCGCRWWSQRSDCCALGDWQQPAVARVGVLDHHGHAAPLHRRVSDGLVPHRDVLQPATTTTTTTTATAAPTSAGAGGRIAVGGRGNRRAWGGRGSWRHEGDGLRDDGGATFPWGQHLRRLGAYHDAGGREHVRTVWHVDRAGTRWWIPRRCVPGRRRPHGRRASHVVECPRCRRGVRGRTGNGGRWRDIHPWGRVPATAATDVPTPMVACSCNAPHPMRWYLPVRCSVVRCTRAGCWDGAHPFARFSGNHAVRARVPGATAAVATHP